MYTNRIQEYSDTFLFFGTTLQGNWLNTSSLFTCLVEETKCGKKKKLYSPQKSDKRPQVMSLKAVSVLAEELEN